MKIVRFETKCPLEDFKPVEVGRAGLESYTYRVNDLEGYRRQIVASQASHVTSIRTDEFGRRRFHFVRQMGRLDLGRG